MLKQFLDNRFTRHSTVDPIRKKRPGIELLTKSAKLDYIPITLSSLAPLGACTVMGKTDQNYKRYGNRRITNISVALSYR